MKNFNIDNNKKNFTKKRNLQNGEIKKTNLKSDENLSKNKEEKLIQNPNYIKSFDGLRAIAVVLVMLYHIIPHKIAGGYLGVVIFLVLSGYLVTDNFLKEMDEHIHLDILNFWKKRIIKLYTPLLPMLSIVSLLVLCFFNDMLNGYVGNLFSSLFGINNIYQIIHGLSYFESHGNPNPFTHLWSLGLEVQFYLIWPILISILYGTLKLKRKNIAIITFILSILSALTMYLLYSPNTDVSRIYYGIDTRAFSFLIGSLFGCLYPRKKVQNLEFSKVRNIGINIFSVMLFSFIIYISIILDAKLDIVYKFGMYFYSLLIGLFLVFILLKDNIMNKLLSLTPLTVVGRRSYSLYLWQYPITIFIGDFLKWSKISVIYLVFIEFIFSIIFAEISYRIFEGKKNYLRYINKKCEEDITNKNLFASVGILAIFIIFSTSILSLSQKSNDIDELKNKLENIQKNNEEKENYLEIPDKKVAREIAKDKEENKVDISKESITFIGDSVMLSSADKMKEEFKNSVIDAKVSRQAWDLPKVLEDLNKKNNIKDIVVIHLGTNYKIDKEKFKEYLKSLEKRQIFLINCVVPEPWEEQVNITIKEISDEMENVKMIDWYSVAKNKKEIFYKDATHPNEKGAKEYTELLKTELSKHIKKGA